MAIIVEKVGGYPDLFDKAMFSILAGVQGCNPIEKLLIANKVPKSNKLLQSPQSRAR